MPPGTIGDLVASVGGFAVTPHDTNELFATTRAVYVGTGGDLKLTTSDGSELTFANLPDASLLPVRATIIWATGTTATDIVGLY